MVDIDDRENYYILTKGSIWKLPRGEQNRDGVEIRKEDIEDVLFEHRKMNVKSIDREVIGFLYVDYKSIDELQKYIYNT